MHLFDYRIPPVNSKGTGTQFIYTLPTALYFSPCFPGINFNFQDTTMCQVCPSCYLHHLHNNMLEVEIKHKSLFICSKLFDMEGVEQMKPTVCEHKSTINKEALVTQLGWAKATNWPLPRLPLNKGKRLLYYTTNPRVSKLQMTHLWIWICSPLLLQVAFSMCISGSQLIFLRVYLLVLH